jgi:quercetin dioxygenase-like cupin family protein
VRTSIEVRFSIKRQLPVLAHNRLHAAGPPRVAAKRWLIHTVVSETKGCAMGTAAGLGLVILLASGCVVGAARAQPVSKDLGAGLASLGASPSVLLVEPIAEKTLRQLAPGPLYWRVERFPTLEAARALENENSLAASAWGASWLFTLDAEGRATPGGLKVAEVGPVPVPAAARLMLRVNRAGGPPGAKTPVHTHPGSEAFFVLKGVLTQRTPHGLAEVGAGKVMNGHEPGMVMQLESTGAEPLEQLVMFLVDADKPFSSPAAFQP